MINDKVLDYLDNWNKGKKKADKIVYTDMSSAVTTMTGGLLNGITTILVTFAAIFVDYFDDYDWYFDLYFSSWKN